MQLAGEILDPWPAGSEGRDPVCARQPVRHDQEREQHHEQPYDRKTDQDGVRDEAPDLQDDDRQGGDGNDHACVDHPLDDHGPERRRPADALAVTQVVAPDQLAEARREHVVGGVSDRQVGEHARHPDEVDRSQQSLPAPRAKDQVGRRHPDHEGNPTGVGRRQDVGRAGQVDLAQDEGERRDRDGNSDQAPDQARACHLYESGRRARSS